jgi:hypothetical protein
MSTFAFKLDPSALPKLSVNGVNYNEWRAAWTLAFKYAELWDVVNPPLTETVSATTRETRSTAAAADAGKAAVKVDEAKDTKAMVMLVSSVDKDLTMMVLSCETSAKAWAHLKDQFDRDTGNLTIYQFRALTSLRYVDGEDLKAHLNAFNQAWQQLAKKCRASSQPVAVSLCTLFESDDVKGSFFLSTLPNTLDHVIDSFATRDVTKFSEMEPKILDIAEKYTINSDSTTAYSAVSRRPRGRQQSSSYNSPAPSKVIPTDSVVCTWCKKHNFDPKGHIYQHCEMLKAFRKDKDQTKDEKEREKVTQHIAKLALKDDSDDSGTEVVAF